MSDLEWVKVWSKRVFINTYAQGKLQLAEEAVIIDKNIID